MTKQEMLMKLTDMEVKLEETLTGFDRGPVRDAMRVTIPMMKDQIEVLRELVRLLPD